MAKLIFGCGYLGQRVARLWREQEHDVYVVTRSAERARQFASTGLLPIIADITVPTSLQQLPEVETVLFAVGYDRTVGKAIHEVYVDGLRNALRALPIGIERFLYTSSTGVYGDSAGDWVDEETPCRPTRDGGRACLAAEGLLADDTIADDTIVLRLAGIYGPDRIPLRKQIENNEPLAAARDGYLNLIHVEDAARIVLLAEGCPFSRRVYVVSDGHPVLRQDYYGELAKLLGASPPQFVFPPPDSPAAARAASDKRIRTTRLLREIKPQFLFPTYREGLASILADS